VLNYFTLVVLKSQTKTDFTQKLFEIIGCFFGYPRPYDSSSVISSPFILSRLFRPLVISYPVISSPGHLVLWSFRPLLSQHPIQFHMCKIIQFHMCKIILKMWYVVTSHIYHNLRSPISLYSNYIYSDTCVTVVTLHTDVTHVTIVTCLTMSHLSYYRKPAITSAECVYGILHFEEISLSLSLGMNFCRFSYRGLLIQWALPARVRISS
jgi:hypothetical protein